MDADEKKVMQRLLKKLTALRKTLVGEERDLLDQIVLTQKGDEGEVEAHALTTAGKVSAGKVSAGKVSTGKVSTGKIKDDEGEVEAHALTTAGKVSTGKVSPGKVSTRISLDADGKYILD